MQERVSSSVEAAAGVSVVSVFSLLPLPVWELTGLIVGAVVLVYLRRSVPWVHRIYYAVSSFAFGSLIAGGISAELSLRFDVGPHWVPVIGAVSVLIAFPFVELVRGFARAFQSMGPTIAERLARALSLKLNPPQEKD